MKEAVPMSGRVRILNVYGHVTKVSLPLLLNSESGYSIQEAVGSLST